MVVCGGLRWFVVVCGGLWWFVVDCGGLSFSHTHFHGWYCSISNMIFSCLSLHPSQHLHFCCIYPSLITFPYRPTFPSICHCRSNCRFIYLVLQCFRDLFVTDDTRHFAPPIPARFESYLSHLSRILLRLVRSSPNT